MSITVSSEIQTLAPYVPGKSSSEIKRQYGLSDVIKLASNENALGVSPKVIEALKKNLDTLNIYPDPSCYDLISKLENYWKLNRNQILIGNGSNELIDLLIRVFCKPQDKIIIPDKSFIAYEICAQAARVGVVKTPLKPNFAVDVDHLVDHLTNKRTNQEKILFLANPNNPTGVYLNELELTKILEATKNFKDFLVILDEAYTEFVRATDYASGIDLLKKYPHVLSIRTFSKVYGLAGLRVGALLGSPDVLQWIHRVRNPFNVNTLAQVAVMASLEDEEYLAKSKQSVWQGLDFFYEEFEKLKIKYIKSQGNFILFDSEQEGNVFFEKCVKKGLILRPLKPYKMDNYIRLTIGTRDENKKALQIISSAFQDK